MAAEGRSLSKLSEETYDFICTACDKANRTLEAVRYCVECLGYCCQECTDLHSRFPALKNHNLLDVDQGIQVGNQQPKLPEFPTERCHIHQGKVLDMYCERHDEVMCYTCVITGHKSCLENHITSIPDMIDTLFKLEDRKQTQGRLRDMVSSMTTIGASYDNILQTLKGLRNEEMEKIESFQKALESIISKAAEMSRNEIENEYKELEKEIQHEKQSAEKSKDRLQESEGKLMKVEGNRAQGFVCSKLAEQRMSETESLLFEAKLNYFERIQLEFKPNQSLMKYGNGLHGIGEVAVTFKLKEDLYKVKRSKDINIRTFDGKFISGIADRACITHAHQLLVTDSVNNKIYRIDIQTLALIDSCELDSKPCGVASVSQHEAVIACQGNKVQFVSLSDKMAATRQLKMSHCCYGICATNDELYITDRGSKLYIYDMAGNLLKTIEKDDDGTNLFSGANHVTFNVDRKETYISNWNTGIVCIDEQGKYMYKTTDSELKSTDGVSCDGRGNIFVVGHWSHNVIQFNEEGKKIGVVTSKQDGLHCPSSVCFDQKLNRLFVTMCESNVVKMYELE